MIVTILVIIITSDSIRVQPVCDAMQVEEIYTTGGDLHLELPTGEREASRELWVGICCRTYLIMYVCIICGVTVVKLDVF